MRRIISFKYILICVVAFSSNPIHASDTTTQLIVERAGRMIASSPIEAIIADSLSEKSTEEQRTLLHAIINWPTSCNETFEYPTAGFSFYKIDTSTYILQVTCTYGAYQGMSLFYKTHLKGNSVTSSPLNLPQSYSDAKGEQEIWGNVLSDSKPNSFTIHNRYSGFGQCGRLTTYNLTKTKPVIISQRREDNCNKTPAVRDPEKWPLVKKP